MNEINNSTMDFEAIIEERCNAIKETLKNKAFEYASGESRYHNFLEASRMRDTTPEDALMGMKIKHDVSVNDLVRWAKDCPERLNKDIINEKIGDSINYLILLEGLLKRRISGNA